MAVQIFADLDNRRLVVSSTSSQEKRIDRPYPPFHQDTIYIEVQPLRINADSEDIDEPYERLDGSGYSLTVGIFTSDGATTLAGLLTSWTPGGVDGYAKVGSLNLNTSNMNTAFTSVLTLTGYILFQFVSATEQVTIRQEITINKSFITTGTPSAVAGVRYLTEADAGTFVKYANNPDGATVTFNNTGRYRILGVNSDGSAQDDLI